MSKEGNHAMRENTMNVCGTGTVPGRACVRVKVFIEQRQADGQHGREEEEGQGVGEQHLNGACVDVHANVHVLINPSAWGREGMRTNS